MTSLVGIVLTKYIYGLGIDCLVGGIDNFSRQTQFRTTRLPVTQTRVWMRLCNMGAGPRPGLPTKKPRPISEATRNLCIQLFPKI